MSGSETALSLRIEKALLKVGIPSERIQSGIVKVRRGVMHLASKGTPDRATPYGWLEIKKPGEKPDAHQTAWHAKWAAHGCNVATVDNVTDAVRIVLAWRAEREIVRNFMAVALR